MPQEPETKEAANATPDRAATARILARSFYRELRSRGYSPRHLLAVSSELIAMVTGDLQRDREDLSRAA